MCLYPKLIINKKYISTKKNGGNIPPLVDIRTKYVPIKCGKCIECKKQISREWRLRLENEIENWQYKYFVTLTFSEESIQKISIKYNIPKTNVNQIATKAVRLMCERYRKKYKKTLSHWLITELGHTGTERIHLHGILLSNYELSTKQIENLWKNGFIYNGKYVNEKSINYITKYILKQDKDHKDYTQIILCSKGIGKNLLNKSQLKEKKYKNKETNETIRLKSGQIINIPIYYRNKIFTEKEREQLWLNRLDKQKRYILGQEIDISTIKGEKEYEKLLKDAQEYNKRLGYISDETWKLKEYNKRKDKLKPTNKTPPNQTQN